MSNVVQDPHTPYNKLILDQTFGKGHNLVQIRKNVNALKAGVVNIAKVRAHLNDKTYAWARHGDRALELDHKFYTLKTDRERAGTIIHEASHALFGSKDNFFHDPIHGVIAVSAGQSQALKNHGYKVSTGCKCVAWHIAGRVDI